MCEDLDEGITHEEVHATPTLETDGCGGRLLAVGHPDVEEQAGARFGRRYRDSHSIHSTEREAQTQQVARITENPLQKSLQAR